MNVGEESIGHHIVKLEVAHNEVWFGVDREKQRLEGVVAGRLLAGQIKDVLGAGDDKNVYASVRELLARCANAGIELRLAKGGLHALRHDGCSAAHALISQSNSRLRVSIRTPRPGAGSRQMMPLA